MFSVSIWLIPEKNQEEQLQKTINDLALTYNAFPFIPHITAYHLVEPPSLDKIKSVIEEQVRKTIPFSLNLEKLAHSTQFTKTLYAQYKISPVLEALYNNLKRCFYPTNQYELSPHLSLIYKNGMSDEDKSYELERLTVPDKLNIDRLMVITRDGEHITKDADVLDWKTESTLLLKS